MGFVQGFFLFADVGDGHVQALLLVERGEDFSDGHTAPGVEVIFGEVAAEGFKDMLPGNVVEGHGVGDGAVAVEEVGAEVSGREFEAEGVGFYEVFDGHSHWMSVDYRGFGASRVWMR